MKCPCCDAGCDEKVEYGETWMVCHACGYKFRKVDREQRLLEAQLRLDGSIAAKPPWRDQ